MAPNSVINTWSFNKLVCWSIDCCCERYGEGIIDEWNRCRRIELWRVLLWWLFGWIRKDWVDEQRRWWLIFDGRSLTEWWSAERETMEFLHGKQMIKLVNKRIGEEEKKRSWSLSDNDSLSIIRFTAITHTSPSRLIRANSLNLNQTQKIFPKIISDGSLRY